MKIIIQAESNPIKIEKFAFDFLPKYILYLYQTNVDKKRLKQLSESYEVDLNKIIIFALSHMYKSKTGNYMYTIGVNKNLKYKGHFVMPYIQRMSYGDLHHKGYPILLQIFKAVSERITIIYEEWLERWQ